MKNPIKSKTVLVGSAVALLGIMEYLSNNLSLLQMFSFGQKSTALITFIIGLVIIILRAKTSQPLKNPFKRAKQD